MRTEKLMKHNLWVLMLAFYVEGMDLGGPGLVRAHNGSVVSLSWTSESDVSNQAFYIRIGITDVCYYHPSLLFIVLHPDFSGITSPDIDTNHLGIRINLVDTRHAHQYNIFYFDAIFDGNATVYVYDEPSQPELKVLGDAHEGIQFTLQCHAASMSLPAANRPQVNMVYTWRNNSEDLDPDDLPERYSITSSGDPANAVNDLLVITGLSRHDAGSYTCTAHEDGSDLHSLYSTSYDLESLYASGRASSEGDQTVNTGHDVTLSCSANDHGRPDGSWIWTTPGGAVVNTSNVGQLTITEATVMNDDGEYSCHLNNHVGDGARGYINVTVLQMPLLDIIENVSLKNYYSLKVRCGAKARPQCNVSWKYVNGSILPSSVFTWTSSLRSDGKYTVTTSYLQWTAGSSPDDRRHKGGGITCVASNVVDDTTTDFILDVQFAPYNIQVNRSADIIEYERLGPVLCSAVCNPPCTYSWYKGGIEVSSNAELMIPNVTRGDHGGYECRPDSGIPGGQTADFDMAVFYGPSVSAFEVNKTSGPINQGDDVTFSCQTDSRPAPVITLIKPSGDTLVSSSTSNTLEHTLTDVDCLDSGDYRCAANNSRTERKDHKQLTIAIQCPPRKHSTSDVRVGAIEGDTVTFSITAIASPLPTFTWFFNGNQLPDPSIVTTTSSSRGLAPEVYVNSTLAISNVTQEDFGNYSVTARNPLGIMEKLVYSLTAAGQPTAPSQLMASHTNAVSITMQWTSGLNRGAEQVFTLMFRHSNSDDSYKSITDISDPGQGETVTSKTMNLTPDSSYDFIVLADNQYGSTQSQLTSAATTVQPSVGTGNHGDFSIVIFGNMATITWSLHSYSGPITHVNVNSCVSDSTNCFLTTVPPTTSLVVVAVPKGGSSYTFEFLVYDGEDLLLSVTHSATVDSGQPVGIIAGVVIAVLLLAVMVTGVGLIARRRRSLSRSDDQMKIEARISNDNRDGSTVPVAQYENVLLHGKSDFLPQPEPERTQPEVDVYDTIKVSDDIPVPTQNEYEFPQRSQIPYDASAAHYEALRPITNTSGTTETASNCVELSEYANINLMSDTNSGV